MVCARKIALSACLLLPMQASAESANEALYRAITINDEIGVRRSLAQGGDPNFNTKPAPLAIAAEKGHVGIVRALLDAGARVDAKDGQYRTGTALMYAAQKGRAEVVRLLLSKGANPNARNDFPREYFRIHGSSPHTDPENQVSALMYAAKGGHTEVASILVAAGAKVNAESYYDETALVFAAANGHAETVRKLLELGADLNANAEAMRQYEASLGIGGGGTALVYALRNKHIDAARVLVNEYVLRKEFVADGDAVFTYALLARDYNIIRALADHKGIDSRKPSYLIIAAQGSTPEILQFLRSRQGSPDVPATALEPEVVTSAARSGDLAKVKLLIEGGANLNARDRNGHNALYYAVYQGATDVASYLIDKGIEINVVGNTSFGWADMGDTALAMAIQKGNVEVVRRLLAAGADVNIKRSSGKSALQVASELGRTDILLLFAAAGRIPADTLPSYVRGKALYRQPETLSADVLRRSGEKLYATQCVVCHKVDGTGIGGQQSLRQAHLRDRSKSSLVEVLLKGVKRSGYEVMEEYGTRLLDVEGAALLAYISDAWGNNLGLSMQAQDVAAARSGPAGQAHEPLVARDADARIAQLAKLGYLYTESLFVEAVRRNDREAVDLFLSAGMSPASIDTRGFTALYVAAMADNAAMVAVLLDKGVDLHAKNLPWSGGSTAAFAAVTGQNCDSKSKALRLMLDRGLDPNSRYGPRTLLMAAIFENCSEAALLLIERRADVNVSEGSWTALRMAKAYQRATLVRALVDAGAKE